MDKIKRVALAEYLNAVRSKAFIISVLAMPLVMMLAVSLQVFAQKKVDLSPRRFAVMDHTGKLFTPLEKAAKTRNDQLTEPPKLPGRLAAVVPPQPQFEPEEITTDHGDATKLEFELSERVRKKSLFAFIVIEANVIDAAATNDNHIRYFTRTPTYNDLPSWIERTVSDGVRRLRFDAAGLDPKQINRLNRRVSVNRLGLAKKTTGGKVEKAKPEDKIRTFAVPIASLMLMFVIVMTSAPMLMNTVLEEKMNKVAEVLISSVSPFQLMFGKLVGCVMVSLTLSGIYLGSIFWFLAEMNYLHIVPWDVVCWFFPFQIMALFIFGSMFLAIGAACNEIRDAQNLMFPAMMLVMVPMLVWMPILQSPNSPFSQAMSLIPPFTPTLMMLRIAAPPGPAMWEIGLAVFLTGGFMLFCVWAAGKIFRLGILSQGQSPSFFKLMTWLWSK